MSSRTIRLLRFPDPTGRRFSDRKFAARTVPSEISFGFENVQAHDVALGVVQDQIQVIEFHDAMQSLREFVEQLAEIAVLRDGFGHFQKSLVPRFRRSAGRYGNGRFAHRSENNTRFQLWLNSGRFLQLQNQFSIEAKDISNFADEARVPEKYIASPSKMHDCRSQRAVRRAVNIISQKVHKKDLTAAGKRRA